MTDDLLTSSYDALIEMLHESDGDIVLASPFLSLPVAQDLSRLAKASTVSWTLLTRVDPVAIAGGYLSTEGLRALLGAGVVIRSSSLLHAKVYLAGSVGIAGSANLTLSGLGASEHPNLEMSLRLTSAAVTQARSTIAEWWADAEVVDGPSLVLAEQLARAVPTIPVPRAALPNSEATLAGTGAELLAEARTVRLWAKAVYGDEDPPDWSSDGDWISSSHRGRPSFAVGDLILIYAKDLRVCNAIVEITTEAEWAPELLLADGRPQEDADRWPWVNFVKGRVWVDSGQAISPEDLGFSAMGLQGGHKRLALTEFAAAVRHLVGEHGVL